MRPNKKIFILLSLSVAIISSANLYANGNNLEDMQANIQQGLTTEDKANFEKFNQEFHRAIVEFIEHDIECQTPYRSLVQKLEKQAVSFDTFVNSTTPTSEAYVKLRTLQRTLHDLCALLKSYVGATGYAYISLGVKLLQYRELMPQCIAEMKANNPDRYHYIIHRLKQLK